MIFKKMSYKLFVGVLFISALVLFLYDLHVSTKYSNLGHPTGNIYCNASSLFGELNTSYSISSFEQVEKLLENQGIKHGGKWSPSDCKPQHHVAILITFLDRDEHLRKLILHLHPILARQKLSYGIYVIEPVKGLIFNKGILYNAGFIESNKESHSLWQCHVFHDVDLFAEDDRTMYECPQNPTHLSFRINKFNYQPPYFSNFGGVTILRKEHYIKSNGYSNLFFGWGAEDDDHFGRVNRFYKIINYPDPYNKFTMLSHFHDTGNPPNPDGVYLWLKGSTRFDREGLNNVKYDVVSVVKTKLYTKFYINYNQNETMSQNFD